ncbi:hypothetical protein OAF54_01675 [bacterium]|nr:hypothetical protein [bacterium]
MSGLKQSRPTIFLEMSKDDSIRYMDQAKGYASALYDRLYRTIKYEPVYKQVLRDEEDLPTEVVDIINSLIKGMDDEADRYSTRRGTKTNR